MDFFEIKMPDLGTASTQTVLIDGIWSDGVDRTFDGSATIRCKVQLDGLSRYTFDRHQKQVLSQSALTFLYSPPGSIKHELVRPGQYERSIIFIYPILPGSIGDVDCDNPAVDHALAQLSDLTQTSFLSMPSAVSSLAHSVFDLDNGPRAMRRRELRSEELSYLLLDIFLDAYRPPATIRLTFRECRQVADAKRILIEHLNEPPSLTTLAAQVGTNRTKLNENFKAETGMSVFRFLLEERMNIASRMLRFSDISITEIAEKCGYEHLSNFSLAFKKFFGASPALYRTGRRL